jgi:hypothetical protein
MAEVEAVEYAWEGDVVIVSETGSYDSIATVITSLLIVPKFIRRRRRSMYDDPSKPRKKQKRWRVSNTMGRRGSAAAVALLLVAVAISAYILMIPQKDRMEMDGEFDDWKGVERHPDDDGDAAYSSINIISTASMKEGASLYFYVEVLGSLFDTQTEGGSVQVFVDSDASPMTGYNIMGIGAEYLVEVYGTSEGIQTSDYYRYADSSISVSTHRIWKWSYVSKVGSGAQNRRLEVALPYHNGNDALMVIRTADDSGSEDLTAVLPLFPEKKRAPLEVTATPLISEGVILAPGDEYVVFRLKFEVAKGSCRVQNVSVEVSGTGSVGGIGSISILRDGVPVRKLLGAAGEVVLELDDVEIVNNVEFTLGVTIAPDAPPGTVLSLDVISVASTSKAITYDLPRRSWYLGQPSDEYIVDGLFNEWSNATIDPRGDARRNIDITECRASMDHGRSFFYLQVDGEMMAGAVIPQVRPMAVEAEDGDQNEYPLPLQQGDDSVYIFLSAGSPDEGYKPEGFPITANRLILTRGHGGEVSTSEHFTFSSDESAEWPWTPDPVGLVVANGRSGLELSVDRNYTNSTAYFQMTTWRNRSGDTTAPILVNG